MVASDMVRLDMSIDRAWAGISSVIRNKQVELSVSENISGNVSISTNNPSTVSIRSRIDLEGEL